MLVERISLPAAEYVFTVFIIRLNDAGEKGQAICTAIIFENRVPHKLKTETALKEEACEHIHALRNQDPSIWRTRIDGSLDGEGIVRFAVTLRAKCANVESEGLGVSTEGDGGSFFAGVCRFMCCLLPVFCRIDLSGSHFVFGRGFIFRDRIYRINFQLIFFIRLQPEQVGNHDICRAIVFSVQGETVLLLGVVLAAVGDFDGRGASGIKQNFEFHVFSSALNR